MDNEQKRGKLEGAVSDAMHEFFRKHEGWANLSYTINIDKLEINCNTVNVTQSGNPVNDPPPQDPPGKGG